MVGYIATGLMDSMDLCTAVMHYQKIKRGDSRITLPLPITKQGEMLIENLIFFDRQRAFDALLSNHHSTKHFVNQRAKPPTTFPCLVDSQELKEEIIKRLHGETGKQLAKSGVHIDPQNIVVMSQKLSSSFFRDGYNSVCESYNEGLKWRREVPGLSSVKGVTDEFLKTLFHNAAEFVRAGPWRYISSSEFLEIAVPSGLTRYASILGYAASHGRQQGEPTHGLVMFDRRGIDSSPNYTYHRVCLFTEACEAPFADLDDGEANGWEVAWQKGNGWHTVRHDRRDFERTGPFPVFTDHMKSMTGVSWERPTFEELHWYSAAFPAIVHFLQLYKDVIKHTGGYLNHDMDAQDTNGVRVRAYSQPLTPQSFLGLHV